MKKAIAVFLCWACSAQYMWAQLQAIAPERPRGFVLIRPYESVTVPPIRLTNSQRLRDLMRGGKIYLTAQDAIALALENNIDLELDRYNPILGAWNIERAEAGGALPGVPSGSTQSQSVASGQGAAGSQQAAGVSSGNSGSNNNTTNASITQIGSVTPVLDPVFQHTMSYAHISTPQSNTVLTGSGNYIQSKHNYTEGISQGLITGGTASLTYNDSYLQENVLSDIQNPTNGVYATLNLQHNLLRGFGRALNSRTININRNALNIDYLTFQTEVMGVVANTLNLYYGLGADYEDVRAKRSAVDVAQQFFDNNKKQVQIGTMAPIDVTTAEAQLASSQQDLVVAETTLLQQQLALKNVMSRDGLADPLLAEAEVVPLDRIIVPERDNLPPMKQMIQTAMSNRVDLQGAKINLTNTQLNALNTSNAVLPTLVGLATAQTQGLSGVSTPYPINSSRLSQTGNSTSANAIPPGYGPCPAGRGLPGQLCEFPDKYFVGGIGTALGQMFRRNFPTQSAGFFFGPTLRNRSAQGDYAIDQLSMRQQEVSMLKDVNQVAVDVSNQSIGLQQARVRYQAAAKSLELSRQLLDAEQKKFKLGASTTFLVVQQQRDLATAQSSEVAALVAYSNARVGLDQTLGVTLQVNHVSIDDAKTGVVARSSTLPATLPQQP